MTLKGELPPIVWVKSRTYEPKWLSRGSRESLLSHPLPMCGHVYLILPDDGSVNEIRQIGRRDWIVSQSCHGETDLWWYNGDNILALNGKPSISSQDDLFDYLRPITLARLENVEGAKAKLFGWVFCLPLRKTTLAMLLAEKGATQTTKVIHRRIGAFAQMMLGVDVPLIKLEELYIVNGSSFCLEWARNTYQPRMTTSADATYPIAGYAICLPVNVSPGYRTSILYEGFTEDFVSLADEPSAVFVNRYGYRRRDR